MPLKGMKGGFKVRQEDGKLYSSREGLNDNISQQDRSNNHFAHVTRLYYVPAGKGQYYVFVNCLDGYEEGALFLPSGSTWDKNLDSETYDHLKSKFWKKPLRIYSDGDVGIFGNGELLKVNLKKSELSLQYELINTAIAGLPTIPNGSVEQAYEGVFKNCSDADGITRSYETSYTVSEEISYEQTDSFGWSESSDITKGSSSEGTITASLGAEIGPVSASVEASATFAQSSESTLSRSKDGSQEKTSSSTGATEKTITETREYTPPANSWNKLTFYQQKLTNIKVPITKTYKFSSNSLNGKQIAEQLLTNSNFKGEITEIGDNFILASINGVVKVKDYYKYNESIEKIGDCSN